MVKKVLIIVVPLILIILVLSLQPRSFPSYPRKSVSIEDTRLILIVADTEARKSQGLSGSAPLHDSEGMLFEFNKPGRYGFWMKDMNYSIDLIYLRSNSVIDIIYDARPDSYPKIFLPTEEFDSVIEVAAGVSKKKGITIGNNLRYNQ